LGFFGGIDGDRRVRAGFRAGGRFTSGRGGGHPSAVVTRRVKVSFVDGNTALEWTPAPAIGESIFSLLDCKEILYDRRGGFPGSVGSPLSMSRIGSSRIGAGVKSRRVGISSSNPLA
jgi:hypothetical protein